MSPFLRRVMEQRNAEQMASIGPVPFRPNCEGCGKAFKSKRTSSNPLCWECRVVDWRKDEWIRKKAASQRLTDATDTGKGFSP